MMTPHWPYIKISNDQSEIDLQVGLCGKAFELERKITKQQKTHFGVPSSRPWAPLEAARKAIIVKKTASRSLNRIYSLLFFRKKNSFFLRPIGIKNFCPSFDETKKIHIRFLLLASLGVIHSTKRINLIRRRYIFGGIGDRG